MPSTMRSVAVTGVREVTTTSTPIPECGPGEVLVRVAYAGICGSDLPRFFDGGVHAFPQVLGHEFSGTVAAAAPDAGIDIGSRVAAAPLVPCHQCDRCKAGSPAQCREYSFIGSRRPGALADYVVVPARNLVPVPPEMSLKAAALVEPLTVAIHAIDLAGRQPQAPIAVLGGGVIGLMAVLALRDRGADNISVTDIAPWNLEVARRLGAQHTLNPRTSDAVDHFARVGAPGLVLETAGTSATYVQALRIAAKAGQIVLVGTPTAPLTLAPEDLERILRGELTVRGSWMSYSAPFPGQEWTDAARILSAPSFDPEILVSHEFGLEEVPLGFEAMRSGQRRLKVMFRVGGEDEQ